MSRRWKSLWKRQPEWTSPKVWTKPYKELDKYAESGKWRKFRGNPDLIVTIDFGTTNCSVHYLLYPGTASSKPAFLKALDPKGRNRVPNCILYNKKDGKVQAFGFRTRLLYAQVVARDRQNYILFAHVKKYLQHDKTISRTTTVKDDFDTEYYLVDVIAQILHYLKSAVMKSITDHPHHSDKKQSDIDWVITVPAIWNAAGKQMMREAAYKAGICSNRSPDRLKPVAEYYGEQPKEIKCDGDLSKLTIALEPECAAIYCLKEEAHRGSLDQTYMLVDIGGGTVDIACHRVTADGHIEEICHPDGNDFGGTVVNETFRHFLEDLSKDSGLQRYIGPDDSGTPSQAASNKAMLEELVYTTFNEEKEAFGSEDTPSSEYYIETPASFYAKYREKIAENRDKNVTVSAESDKTQIIVTKEKMTEFFQPSVDAISKLLLSKQLLSGPIGKAVTTIYWVGGFGSSPFLRSKLEAAIKAKCGSNSYKFYCPPDPELAVVRGATEFRCDPDVIQKRKANATYGVGCKVPFVEGVHNPAHKVYIKDREEYWCDKIFCTFIKKGDDICINTAIVYELVALHKEQKTMTLTVYSSPNETVRYTTEDDIEKLAEVEVKLHGEGRNRYVQITFDAAQTEIQIRAYQLPQGEEVKTVVDCLDL